MRLHVANGILKLEFVTPSRSIDEKHVANGTLKLEFVTPSPSMDKITCCERKSKPWIRDSGSLN
jgi:hypothetical protein